MIQRYAILDSNGNVVNVCLWDGNTETWQPPTNHTAVLFDAEIHIFRDASAPPEPPGVAPPNLDFELGVTQEDQLILTSDLTGFQNRIIIGELTPQDTFTVVVADKFGTRHNVPFNEYLAALAYYHGALRYVWETNV